MTHLPDARTDLKQAIPRRHPQSTAETSISDVMDQRVVRHPILLIPLPVFHLNQEGIGPHSVILSQRRNRGEVASLLQILDAALEIVDSTSPVIMSSSSAPTPPHGFSRD
ncbi:hypothetical protein IV203_025772 [Nitzschia inconspicua]|uniref:Uncharacterized protein n=1 Tax=Nitzschia inconspicua TaxID=303405 RepID=A0A9K3LJU2_9STRA|nr:hypothetical protein IV203_025772 [Nitzschia inconspicua]